MDTFQKSVSGIAIADQKGMTLVEVMVASAVASILALGVATMTTNLQKGVKGVEKSGDWADFKSNVRGSLLSERGCKGLLNLAGMAINTNNASTLSARSNLPVYFGSRTISTSAVGMQNIYGGLRMTNVSLSALTNVSGTSAYTATLRYSASTKRNPASSAPAETLGAQDYTQSHEVRFYPPVGSTTPNLLTECIGVDSDSSAIHTTIQELVTQVNDLTSRVQALETWRTGTVTPKFAALDARDADLQAKDTELSSDNVAQDGRIEALEQQLNSLPAVCNNRSGSLNPPNDGSYSGWVAAPCNGNLAYVQSYSAFECDGKGDSAVIQYDAAAKRFRIKCTDAGAGGSNSDRVNYTFACCNKEP